jgi:hypothetical protein
MAIEGGKSKRLYDFLLGSFSPDEFRRLLEFTDGDFARVDENVNPKAAPADYFYEVIKGLQRKSLINARFFERLREELPAKKAEINNLEELCLRADPLAGPGGPADVFIVYAYFDDQPDENVRDGWVTTLAGGLRRRLATRLGRDANLILWHDRQDLPGPDPVESARFDAIAESATLLVILSRAFLRSDFCAPEPQAFLRSHADQPDILSRIFVVERDQAAQFECPPEFATVQKHCFWYLHKLNGDTGVPRTLGYPVPNPYRDDEYFSALDRLSYALGESIERLRPGTRPAFVASGRIPRPEQPARRPAVFLARPTPDLNERYGEVRQHLLQAGLRVLSAPSHLDDPNDKREPAERNNTPLLVVQLLSSEPNRTAVEPPRGLTGPRPERDLPSTPPILEWRDERLRLNEVVDPDQRDRLTEATVYAEGIEEFKARIVRQAESPSLEPTPTPGEDSRVFITADRSDRALAGEVAKVLGQPYDARNLNPKEYRADLFQKLQACHTVLVVCRDCPDSWIKAQFADILRVGVRRSTPIRMRLLDARPPGRAGLLPPLPAGTLILDCRGGLDPGAIRQLRVPERQEAGR